MVGIRHVGTDAAAGYQSVQNTSSYESASVLGYQAASVYGASANASG